MVVVPVDILAHLRFVERVVVVAFDDDFSAQFRQVVDVVVAQPVVPVFCADFGLVAASAE